MSVTFGLCNWRDSGDSKADGKLGEDEVGQRRGWGEDEVGGRRGWVETRLGGDKVVNGRE